MSRFDPVKERKLQEGDCGYEFYLSRDIRRFHEMGGRGSYAHGFLGKAIACLLIGLAEPARQLLTKAKEWVIAAIAENEVPEKYRHDKRYTLDGDMADRYQTLALCNWLLLSEHDTKSYLQSIEHEDRFFAVRPDCHDKTNVSFALPTYVDAGTYQRALELFGSTPGMSVPSSLGSIRSEGQMSYVLARHRLGQDYTEEAVALATQKFLNRNVDNWLSNGHWVRAAEWMKIVYWKEGKAGLSATEALMKCYDHLDLPGPTQIAMGDEPPSLATVLV